MLWRNGEHYPDPTAGAAFQRIAREEVRNEMNEGKRFERDFKASVPPDACELAVLCGGDDGGVGRWRPCACW